MEFKGVKWAGNIYQKFETMCLEVEEVMYEDTVKYMETQVQKVGASVKKFCSEVMEDLHSPSCVDPVKVAAGELSLNPYAHNDIVKKPKSNILYSHGELKKKDTEDINAEKSTLNHFNDSSSALVEKTPAVLCSANSKNLGIQKRRIGIKRISQHNRPPKVSSAPTSLLEDARSSCVVGSHEIKVTPSSEFVVRLDPGEPAKESKPTSDPVIKSPASHKVISPESVRQKKDDSECTSSGQEPAESIGTSMKDTSVSQASSSLRTNNACEVESVGKDVMASKEGKFVKDGSSPQLISNVRSNKGGIESEGDDVVVSYEDIIDMEDIEMEAIDNAEVVEARVQVFEPVEKSNLEESCVLVDDDNLQNVSQGTKKHKSYKKKIREAISSKLRSTRNQDERIFHHKDLDRNNKAGVAIGGGPMMGSGETKSSAQDSTESDWELL